MTTIVVNHHHNVVKGNNGRAARRRKLWNLLLWMFIIFCILLSTLLLYQFISFLFHWLLLNNDDDDYNYHHHNNNNNNNINELKQGRAQRWRAFYKWSARNNNNNNKQLNDDDTTTTTNNNNKNVEDIIQRIIEGELSLVDLQPNMIEIRKQQHEQQNNLNHNNDHDDDVVTMNYENYFRAKFCKLDWSDHEKDPSQTPMFRDVIAHSKCGGGDEMNNHNNNNPYHYFDLYQIVQSIRKYDNNKKEQQKEQQQREQQQQHEQQVQQQHEQQQVQQHENEINILELGGFIFHESRCGSTLIANILQAQDPIRNVVYSESGPPITIARLYDPTEEKQHQLLSLQQASIILRDVIYLMSRRVVLVTKTDDKTKTTTTSITSTTRNLFSSMTTTKNNNNNNNDKKRRVFFKIQSIGTLSLPLFRYAFPTTPYVFVYRDPTEVLMSHLGNNNYNNNILTSSRKPLCAQTQPQNNNKNVNDIPLRIRKVVQKYAAAASTTTIMKNKDDYNNNNNNQEEMINIILQQLTVEQYCACHLASLTEMALHELLLEEEEEYDEQQQQHEIGGGGGGIGTNGIQKNKIKKRRGIAINYNELPSIMWDVVLPKYFNISLINDNDNDDEEESIERMKRISTTYSKGRGLRAKEIFISDSKQKQYNANSNILLASKQFLLPSYNELQKISINNNSNK